MKKESGIDFEQAVEQFLSAYGNGVFWEEEFYPSFAMVLKIESSDVSAFDRKRKKEEFLTLVKIAQLEKEESSKQALKKQKKELEAKFQSSLALDFIERVFSEATPVEKRYIKAKIQDLCDQTDPRDLRYELESFLFQGLAGIRRLYSRENGIWIKGKKYLGYLWDVLICILEVLILMVVIGAMDDRSATLITAGLAMVYLQIRAIALGGSLMYPRILEAFNKEFIQIRMLFEDGSASLDFGKAIRAAQARRDLEVRTYIRIGFLALMSAYVTLILVVTALR